jgi:predicted RNA-binding protein YlqC (UPF0109 family)
VKGASLKELIEYMAKSLVDQPDTVQVEQHASGSKVQLELKVAKEDMGRVIGKDGRVANAIRTLLKVATRDDRRVVLEIV